MSDEAEEAAGLPPGNDAGEVWRKFGRKELNSFIYYYVFPMHLFAESQQRSEGRRRNAWKSGGRLRILLFYHVCAAGTIQKRRRPPLSARKGENGAKKENTVKPIDFTVLDCNWQALPPSP